MHCEVSEKTCLIIPSHFSEVRNYIVNCFFLQSELAHRYIHRTSFFLNFIFSDKLRKPKDL